IFGSMIFYGYWKPVYVIGPPLLILLSFSAVIAIKDRDNDQSKSRWLTAVIVLLTLPLLIFKYSNFIVNDVFGFLHDSHGKV
ncbi:hypothetical protein, partial [Enterococcus faecalis]|uniref:hypothetical protein n=1 Tax=Enterococcus faecalis TaxID=1351 RepID=UPI00403F01CC